MPMMKKLVKHLKRRTPRGQVSSPSRENIPLSGNVKDDLHHLSELLGHTEELHTMEFDIRGQKYGLAYLKGVAEPLKLQEAINGLYQRDNETSYFPVIVDRETTPNFAEALAWLTRGYGVLFTALMTSCELLPAASIPMREPSQAETTRSIRGPKNGFIEDSNTNHALIRSKLKDKNLRVRKLIIGTRSQTLVQVLYIEDLAQPELIKTILERLELIKVDSITDGIDLAQFIVDSWFTPFPLVEYAERPDVVVDALCQGRIALLPENSPSAILAPTTFFDFLDVPDDYYTAWSVSASIIRFIRLTALLLAAFLPSMYIALTAYNPDFIPTNLALIIAASREGVPFPTPVEALLLVSIVEISREAVLRLPKDTSMIAGIAGVAVAIIAALATNLFSSTMLIVIFFGVICSSTIPDYDLQLSVRELQFFFMIMASFLGIFGVSLAFIFTCIHLVTLKSFGIPYMSPVAPLLPGDWAKILFRFPSWAMPRMKTYHSQDSDRSSKTVDRKEGEKIEKDSR